MPNDPVIQEFEDIRADVLRGEKQTPSDPEKQEKQDMKKYSVQAHADKAPWDSSSFPGIGPGFGDTVFGSSLFLNMANYADEIMPWSFYPMQRDRQLRRIWKQEGVLAGALYSMSARYGALPYKIKGPKRAKQRSNTLVHGFDVKKFTLDLMTTDNGGFIERIGPGRPDKALNRNLIQGLAVMDSGQVWRTFDPEFPVIYINPYTAQYHKIHYSRVICASSMPQPEELARGIGFCPVSRSLRFVQIMRDIEIYKHEKVGGRFRRALGLIKGKGFTKQLVNDTLDSHELKQDAIGLTRFSQIPFFIVPDGDADIILKDLASLPDGFDVEKEFQVYVYCLALGFGTDAREFWPATQSGATKADATVQHEKARGKGFGDIVNIIELALNWGGLPDNVTIEYDYQDDSLELQIAQVHGQRILNVTALQNAGNLTIEQGNAVLVSQGVLDPEVLTIQAAEEEDPALNTDPDSGEETPADLGGTTPQQDAQNTPKQSPQPTPKPVPPQFAPTPSMKPSQKARKSIDDRVNQYRDELIGLLDDVDASDPETSAEEVKKKYRVLLAIGLTAAAGIGLSGKKPSKSLIAKLGAMAATSMDYFNGFTDDLKTALAQQPTDQSLQDTLAPLKARIATYSGTYWQGIWTGAGDAVGNVRVKRELDPNAKHCDTCPPKEGIYDSFEEMEAQVGIPGDGSDDCLGNCRCRVLVETEPGSGEFVPMIGSPTVFTAPIIPEDYLQTEAA